MMNNKIILLSLLLVSFSFALPSWTGPTPANNTPYGDAHLILNISDDSAMDYCNFEIDGVNQSGTLAGDLLSCSYELSFPEKYVGHHYSVIGYDSVSSVEYATNTRTIAYYGCGLVNQSVQLKTDVTYDSNSMCFQFGASDITLDGKGYTMYGLPGALYGVFSYEFSNITIEHLNISNFNYAIWILGDATPVYDVNIIGNNISYDAQAYGTIGIGVMPTYGNRYNIINNTVFQANYNLYLNLDGVDAIDVNVIGNTLTDAYLDDSLGFLINRGNGLFMKDNRLINNRAGSYIAIQNVTLRNNFYNNRAWDEILDCTSGYSGQLVNARGETFNETKVDYTSLLDGWAGQQFYFLGFQGGIPTPPPAGNVSIGNKGVYFIQNVGGPQLNTFSMYWDVGDIVNTTWQSIELWNYQTGTWTLMANNPNPGTRSVTAIDVAYPYGGEYYLFGHEVNNTIPITTFTLPMASENQSVIPETFWLFMLIVVSLLVLAEVSHNPMWGVVCGLLFIIAGGMIAMNGNALEMKTGANYTTYNGTAFNSSIGTLNSVQTEVYTYTPIPFVVPAIPTIIFFLMGIALMWSYMFRK